jgi:hypothetical protein
VDGAADGLECVAADQQRDAGYDQGAERARVGAMKCAREQTMLCGELHVRLDRLRRIERVGDISSLYGKSVIEEDDARKLSRAQVEYTPSFVLKCGRATGFDYRIFG